MTPAAAPGALVLAIRGRLRFPEVPGLRDEVGRATAALAPGTSVRLDLSGVEQADGAAVAVLAYAESDLRERGVPVEIVGARGSVAEVLRVYRDGGAPLRVRPRRAESGLVSVGRGAAGVAREAVLALSFLGAVLTAAVSVLRRPRSANVRDIPPLLERAGADAVPIVLVISFLIGAVTAGQSAIELRRFGALLYVADLVGLSITRELGPIMTAVVVTGRTGAAFAAELGSMQVAEEIDALRTLGFDPLRFLVLPRMVALTLVLPLLTLLADGAGMFGGFIVGVLGLDLGARVYFTETRTVVFTADIASGVIKSVGFALAIGLISCHQGLAASGGAAGVGRRTTAAVVSILFCLIVIDAIFTYLQR